MVIEEKEEDSDIISIENEQEEKMMNLIYEENNENNNLTTPFSKLIQISKAYGTSAVIDRMMNIVSPSDSKTVIGISKDITKDVKDIIKNINTDTLNLYLIKLVAYNQRKNFNILNEFKMSNDKNFVKFLNKRKEGKNPLDDLNQGIISDDESEKTDDKDKINNYKEYSDESNEEEEEDEDGEELSIKEVGDGDDNNDNNNVTTLQLDDISDDSDDDDSGIQVYDEEQYRFKHFFKKENNVYCFIPKKNTLKSTRFNLYCSKYGCKAKLRIDMLDKTAKEKGDHNNHEGINIDHYIKDYPELKEKGWKNLQYDLKNNQKVLAWKR